MKPYEQGALDSLCGVYSLINATRFVSGTSNDECDELFGKVIHYLEEQEILASVLYEGIFLDRVMKIAANVLSERLPVRKRPFKGTDPSLEEFWQAVNSFVDCSNQVVLLGIGGKHDHWTLVTGATDKEFKLYDSVGLSRLRRAYCTVGDVSKKRKHSLNPRISYFLSLT